MKLEDLKNKMKNVVLNYNPLNNIQQYMQYKNKELKNLSGIGLTFLEKKGN